MRPKISIGIFSSSGAGMDRPPSSAGRILETATSRRCSGRNGYCAGIPFEAHATYVLLPWQADSTRWSDKSAGINANPELRLSLVRDEGLQVDRQRWKIAHSTGIVWCLSVRCRCCKLTVTEFYLSLSGWSICFWCQAASLSSISRLKT
jgi:hypothetical protein